MRESVLIVPSKFLNTDDIGVVTRFVVGAMLLSHGVRADARAHIIFDREKCITFDGKSMRNVRPDEQSLSGILRAGIERAGSRTGTKVMKGISARKIELEHFLSEGKGAKLYYAGPYGRVEEVPKDFFVVFGYPKLELEEALSRAGFMPLNLGKATLLPDQAVVVLNNRLDCRLMR